jgi:GNAT superfamily N-acetyltransferase
MPTHKPPLLRAMRPDEADVVAALIHDSTNAWYRRNRGFEIFTAGPQSCRLFTDVYEALDPGRCVVAEDRDTARLMGSCFYHPRQAHVSLGIMNVHPDFFGRGVAAALLRHITDFADAQGKPTRLVSSAMNLDSFSLYSRAGFVPQATFADMQVPPARASEIVPPDTGQHRFRLATPEDVPRIAGLEQELSGIRRDADFAYFIRDEMKIWRTTVAENERGGIDAFLVSVAHAASNMLGPGAMRDDRLAAALVGEHLRFHAVQGRAPVSLIPLNRADLVRQMYAWGARNLELHFSQVRGPAGAAARGVIMPTFMPETG